MHLGLPCTMLINPPIRSSVGGSLALSVRLRRNRFCETVPPFSFDRSRFQFQKTIAISVDQSLAQNDIHNTDNYCIVYPEERWCTHATSTIWLSISRSNLVSSMDEIKMLWRILHDSFIHRTLALDSRRNLASFLFPFHSSPTLRLNLYIYCNCRCHHETRR